MKARVYIETYGCTLNQADSDIIAGILGGLQFRVSSLDEADVIILNTCTVKGPTENRIIERIKTLENRKRDRLNKVQGSMERNVVPLETGNGKLVISGCMAANAERLRKITDAPIVWPGALARIGDAVEDALCGQVTEYKEIGSKDGLARSVTKPIMRIGIAEGCTNACYFCQTKLARPGLKSMNPKKVLQQVSEGVKQGVKEIQLTAMDTGVYGMDTGTDLPKLLNCINEIEGDFLVRLGMINPEHVLRMKDDLINALQGEHLYKFLHAPVQSGSERVCREMNRKHGVKEFEGLAHDLRAAIPDITIATDIIVGYPTETRDDFEDTLALLDRVKPDVVNLSKFSPRPGTKAKELDQLHNDEIKRRSIKATGVVRRITEERNRLHIGKTVDVLITEKQKDYTGRTPSYKQVVIRDFDGELGMKVKVKITEANHGSLFGFRL